MATKSFPDPQNDRDALTELAARCRRLADALTDRRTITSLTELARDYENRARDRSD